MHITNGFTLLTVASARAQIEARKEDLMDFLWVTGGAARA